MPESDRSTIGVRVKLNWKFSPNRENLIALLVVAVLIGMTTGALAVAFRYLLLYTTDLFWPDPLAMLDVGQSYPWLLILLIPVCGGLLVGPLVGMLSMSDLKSFLGEVGELSTLVIASEVMTRRVVIVRPKDNFETAFEIFEGKQISTLPVVADDGRLLGILKKMTCYSPTIRRFSS